MSERPIRVVRPTDPVTTIRGAGDDYRFLATGAETDGGYFLVEATVPPGGGPPWHIQTREEEAFYILAGEVTFYGAHGETVAGPGTYLNIPKGARHRFRNNADTTARMLFFFTPAGLEGMFEQMGRLGVPAGGAADRMAALRALGEPYGIRFLAPEEVEP